MVKELSIIIADAARDSSASLADKITSMNPQAVVSTAETGTELIAALQNKNVYLVLQDMILSNTDISKLRKAMHTFLNEPTSKLVLVSEALRQHWFTIAITLKAYEVLLKPYKPNSLVRLIETYQHVSLKYNAIIVHASVRSRKLVRSAMEDGEFQIAFSHAAFPALADPNLPA